jgi:hypothetical protein
VTRRVTMLIFGMIVLGLGTLAAMLAFIGFCDKV